MGRLPTSGRHPVVPVPVPFPSKGHRDYTDVPHWFDLPTPDPRVTVCWGVPTVPFRSFSTPDEILLLLFGVSVTFDRETPVW